MDAVAQEKPVVDSRYYDEAVRWETSENSAIRLSRNAWRAISIIIGLALVRNLHEQVFGINAIVFGAAVTLLGVAVYGVRRLVTHRA